MRSTRKLELRRETLAELTTREMHAVIAGLSGLPDCVVTADVTTCFEATLTMCPDFYCTGTC